MKKKIDIYQLMFVIVFIAIFTRIRPLLPFDNNYRIIIGGILGGLGGLTGGLVYKLFEKKKVYIQLLFLCCVLICSILALSYFIERSTVNKNKNPLNTIVDSYLNDMKTKIDKSISRVGSTYKMTSSDYSKLKTCDVCGYISVLPDSAYCFNCYNGTWESERSIYNDKKEWLADMQEIYFTPDSVVSKIDFYKPDSIDVISNTFVKDKKWKPTVTEKAIIDKSKEGK